MDNSSCLRCRRPLEPTGEQIAVFIFAQTVGMRPRQKGKAYRVHFCPGCAVSTAFGPSPETALNMAAWQSLRDLIGADAAVTKAAWDRLHNVTTPPQLPAHDDGVITLEAPQTLPFGVAARVAS